MTLSRMTKAQLLERIQVMERQLEELTANPTAASRPGRDRLEILNEVTRATVACRTGEELSEALAWQIRRIMPVDSFLLDGCFHLTQSDISVGYGNFDTINGVFQRVAVDPSQSDWDRGPLRESLFERFEPMLVLRRPEDLNTRLRNLHTFGDNSRRSASMIYVPLVSGRRCVGVMAVMSYEFNAYGEEHVDLLMAIANQVAPAVEGVALMRALTDKTEALAQSEERLRAFVQALPDAAFVIDEDGTYLNVLAFDEPLLYRHAKDLEGKRLHDLFPREEADRYLAAIRKTIQTGQTQICEYYMDVLQGPSWFEGRTAPMRGRADKKRMVVWIARDITERKRSADRLRDNEQFLQSIFDAIQDGIAVLDENLTILRVNNAMKRWYPEHPAPEGQKCHWIYQHRDDPCDRCPSLRALQTGTLQSEAISYLRDGKPAGWFELYSFPILDASGRPRGVVEYVRDITRHREVEQAIRKAHEELERRVEERTAELSRANESLREEIVERQRAERERQRLEQMQRDFMANVSHELKTPLTSIRGYAETLLEGALEDRKVLRNFLEIIHDNAVRMEFMTNDLLQISLLESGQLQLDRRPIDVSDLIESSVKTAHMKASQKDISIQIDYPPRLPQILGDSHRLREVLQNLLDNAIQYSPEHSRVVVKADANENYILLSVIDNGIGIPRKEQGRVFERLYRVDSARSRKEGGTGLGLAIVKELVKAHGGFIELRSQEGKGSTFTVYLPYPRESKSD